MSATFGLYFKNFSQEEANAMRLQLNEVAASHGYTATRGATAGQGNAAELLVAIASGEIATVLLMDEERSAVVAWLDAQANAMQSENALLADSLRSLAIQLWNAVKRERDAEEAEMRGNECVQNRDSR